MRWFTVCWVLVWSFVWSALAAPTQAIQDIRELAPVHQEMVARHGAENVLVILDYDNTIAETPADLGSEAWFMWQQALMAQGEGAGSVVRSYDELVLLQHEIFQLYPGRVTQPETAAAIRALQTSRSPVMVLTSRNPVFHDVTTRDLASFGIDFSRSGPALPARAALPPETLYRDGIFFTRGRPKGPMLRAWLHAWGQRPKAILFVDDRLKHAESVEAEMSAMGIETSTVLYTHTEPRVRAIEASDKRHLHDEYRAFLLRRAQARAAATGTCSSRLATK